MKNSTDRQEKLATRSIPALLAHFAIPSILSLVLHSLYNIADRIFIGRGVGPSGLAGVTLCFPAVLLLFGLCVLFSSGAAALISICLGQGRRKEAEKVLGTTFFLITITGLVMGIAGAAFSEHFLSLFNASDEVLVHAQDYLRIMLTGSPVFLFGFTLTFIIRAEGNPFYATAAIVTGTLLNLVLDPLFIFVLSMGTTGAALATVISEGVVTLMGLAYLLGRKGAVHIRIRDIRPDPVLMRRICYIGLSPAFMNLAASIQTVFVNNKLLDLGGDTAVAAVGIILPIASTINLFTYGMASGMQPIIGFNHGAGHLERVRRTFRYACTVNFIAVALLVATVILLAERTVGLFVPDEGELLALSAHAIRIFLFMSPFAVINILGSRLFQAIGEPATALGLGLLRQLVIFLPLLYTLSRYMHLDGVWYSAPLSDLLAAFVTVAVLYRAGRAYGSRSSVRDKHL